MEDLFSLDGDEFDVSTQRRIDEVCIAFEDAWKSKARPKAEDFAARLPETARGALLHELLLLELDYRRRLGEEPLSEEYESRFPNFREVVAAVFERTPSPETPKATPHDVSQQDTLPFTGLSDSRQSPSDAGRSLGRFELREQLGAGGFGTVYRAYDTTLHREVALKVPHPGRFETEESQVRVLREARAAAQLYHPHIVPVHDAGMEQEVFYIASAFVEGESLAETLARRQPDFDEAATIVLKLAAALHYAHEQGIVHRDVKPGNVMMDSAGSPLLMDFGLARFLESEDRLTHDGMLLGTPAYMSPEQARGENDRVGPHSDQYSLGVVLYQLLCGNLPFSGTPAVVVLDVAEKEPPAPRTFRRHIPRDLETICLKSCAMAPEERYASCQQLADDLERWLQGEPIAARPIGMAGRIWRWCKRKPVVASLSAALVLALLIGSLVSMVFGVMATRNAHDLSVALADLGEKKTEAETQRNRADNERQLAEEERDRAEANFYINQLALARYQADQGNMAVAERLLDDCPQGLRHFEWGYLKRLCHLETKAMRDRGNPYGHVAVSPDGKRIVSGAVDEEGSQGVMLWDAQTGEPLLEIAPEAKGLYDLAYSPDGRHVAAVLRGDKSARVWDATSGEEWMSIGKPDQEGAASIAFAPDGQRLAVGGRSGKIWVYDLATKKQLQTIATGGGVGQPLQLSAEVERQLGPEVKKQLSSMAMGHGLVQSLEFSPDGNRIASEGQGVFQLWDAASGQAIRTITQDPKKYGKTSRMEGDSALAFSPGGRRIATAAPKVAVWDADTGERLLEIDATAGDLAFSPDGRQLAGNSGGMIKLWDSLTGEEIHTIFGRYAYGKLAFMPDGRRLVTGGGMVCLWDLDESQEAFDLELRSLGGSASSWTVAFHPESHAFGVVNIGTEAAIYDTETAEKVATLGQRWDGAMQRKVPPQELMRWAPYQSVALSLRADGMQMAEVCPDKTARIWGVDSRSPIATIQSDQHLRAVTFSPDGKRVALATEDTAVELWDVAQGERLRRYEPQSFWGPGINPSFRLPGFEKPVLPSTWVALRPDGRHVALAVCTGGVKVWDVASGDEVYTLQTHPALRQIGTEGKARRFFFPMAMTRLAYSCDSRQLATCSDAVNAAIRVWDADSGEQLGALEGHTRRVNAMAFSSDGRRLVSGSQDKTVRIWDVPNRRELIRFETPGEVWAVAISPDDRHVACWLSSSGTPMVRIWDAVKGDDLSFPRRSRSRGVDRFWSIRSAYPLRKATQEAEPTPQPVSYQHMNKSGVDQVTLRLCVCHQPYTELAIPPPKSWDLQASRSEEPLQGEREYASNQVRYCTLKMGNGPDPTFTLAIDRAPGEPPVIYFDQNNDEDLTNDGPGRWPDQFAGTPDRDGFIWNVPIDVPYKTGTISQYVQLQWSVGTRQSERLSGFLSSSRKCTVESNGTKYTIILVDKSMDACFDDMNGSLIVRPNGGPAPFTGLRAPPVTTPFELGGEKWKVAGLSVDGTEMTLEPFREPAKKQPAKPEAGLRDPRAAEAQIVAALEEPVEAVFTDVPLKDVMDSLGQERKIPIELDIEALTEAGISRNAPIICKLTGMSLRSALTVMLRQLDLTFLIYEGKIVVTTPRAEQRMMITKTYPIADLYSPSQLSHPNFVDYDSLIDLLFDHVAPSTWENVGGPGSIKRDQLDRLPALTVQASYHVHEKVADCLKQLRCEIRRVPSKQVKGESRPPSTNPKPPPDNVVPDDGCMTLENALQASSDLEFQHQPLSAGLVPTLRKRLSINALVDRRELVSAGIDPEAPISGTASGIPLDEALNKILEPHNLSWTVHEGVVLITTPKAVDELLVTRVYRAAKQAEREEGVKAAEAIMRQVTANVAPNTWDHSGGPGSIQHVLLWPVHAFLVRQTCRVHRQLAVADELVPIPSGNTSRLTNRLAFVPKPLRVVLSRPIDLRFSNIRLENAVETIRCEQSIPLVIDARELEDVNVRPDTKLPSDFEVVQLPAAQALTLMLRNLDLTWVAEGDVITITTYRESQRLAQLRTYALADLPIVRAKYDAFVESIASCVAPTTWDCAGGPGSIEVFRAGGVPPLLAVYNEQGVHAEISEMMADLREASRRVRRSQIGSGDEAGSVLGTSHTEGKSALPTRTDEPPRAPGKAVGKQREDSNL